MFWSILFVIFTRSPEIIDDIKEYIIEILSILLSYS